MVHTYSCHHYITLMITAITFLHLITFLDLLYPPVLPLSLPAKLVSFFLLFGRFFMYILLPRFESYPCSNFGITVKLSNTFCLLFSFLLSILSLPSSVVIRLSFNHFPFSSTLCCLPLTCFLHLTHFRSFLFRSSSHFFLFSMLSLSFSTWALFW